MTTLSEQPVFKELGTLVKLVPSSEDPNIPDFKECHAATCRLGTKLKQNKAKAIWDKLMKRETLSNEVEFYSTVKQFLPWIHCKRHNSDNFLEELFDDWKRSRIENSAYASSEVSLPGTPTQNQVFESPAVGYDTPLSSPLVEDGTPTTPEKSPASSFDSFIMSTPSRMNHHSPLPTIEDMSTSDESPRYIPPLALGINSPPDKAADVGQPDNIVENITEVNVISPGEPPKWLPIHSRQDVAAEQPDIVETIVETIVDDTVIDENDSDDEPRLAHPQFGELGIKRNGTLSDKSAIIRELRKPLTHAQAREGKVYVLKHKEEKDMFKIGWTATTVNTSLSRPNNCYGASCETKPIYESHNLFNGARKAHRLAHLFLRDINVRVNKCKKCGKGHKDWFEGREEAIVGTVKVMEGFLRRPAYELKEKRELSDEGKAMVKNMCNVTLESFQRNEESYGIPGHVTGAESLTITHTVVPEATVDVHSRQGQVDESSSQPEALAASADATKELEPPLEANKGGFRNKVKELCGNMKDKISKEPAGAHKNSTNDDEFLIALLGALDQDSDNTERPRGWSSLGVVWAKFTAIFKRSVEPDAKKAS
ncbi:hypothetical protein ACKAV7_007741 [Fusarium commune]|uniref:Bacteriophage T5 Orf172 DNA-binding domain-containing protein n=1 Tax=Fusarium oxysporum f. sp. rapae TaxID=485398 RepID=A0A8J5NVD1_FUSOX|nr:hypothetical protein Forpe1208_v007735 [Fusarium oxysporum f. sp. rapae]KAI7769639.1 hypothetical protein LZL87_003129 [Fusarium oxysporum]